MPSQQARTMEAPLRWPLVNRVQARSDAVPTKDQRLINAYAEYDPDTKEYWVYKRPGLSANTLYGSSRPGRGLYTDPYTGYIVAANDQEVILFYPNSSFAATLGLANPTAAFMSFESINSAPRTVVLHNGIAGWILDLSTSSLSQITDPNFPPNSQRSPALIPGWAYIDGTLYAMDFQGGIWGTSGMDNAANWGGLNLVKASSNADAGVALAKQLNYLVALKQYTTQVFYDAGNAAPGSPLSPVPDSQIPFGCFGAYTVQSIDNTLLWVTSNKTASPQVIQMDNLASKIVSTPTIDKILDNVTFTAQGSNISSVGGPGTFGGLFSWVLKHGGHRFYAITSIYLNITLVYDLDQKLWYIWTDPNGNYWPVSALSYVPPSVTSGSVVVNAAHLAQDYNNGNIYYLDNDAVYPNDNGVLFPVDIYTPNFDAGVDRVKVLNMMRFNADQTNGSILKVRHSNDDYQTWSNFRTVNLARERPILTDEGAFYRRAYHFRHMCNKPLRLKTVDLQLDIGVA